MDRVGILTFVWSRNYGAKLQAYALQTAVSSLGFDCEVINFRRKQDCRTVQFLDAIAKVEFGRIVKECAIESVRWRKHRRLDAFTERQLRLSPSSCLSLEELTEMSGRYGAIIVGSDQVWNPDLTGEALPCYLLDFPASSTVRRIAYAASMGWSTIGGTQKELFSRCLKRFDSISVRERSVAPFVASLAGKEVTSVLDPTLLLTDKDWMPVARNVTIKHPFLLIYSFGTPPALAEVASRIAKERGLRIVTFHACKHYFNETKRMPNAGPREFLGLFLAADYVVTNSFHGTVFAVLFRKPFVSLAIDGSDTRVSDLLADIGLSGRLMSSRAGRDAVATGEIDYAGVDARLVTLRKRSVAYLRSSLDADYVETPAQTQR